MIGQAVCEDLHFVMLISKFHIGAVLNCVGKDEIWYNSSRQFLSGVSYICANKELNAIFSEAYL